MKASELFTLISPELRSEIISHMDTQHPAAYRLVLTQLAAARKMRPVFMAKKSKAEQIAFLEKMLGVRSHHEATLQVIQLWLLKGQQDMLGTFLDAVGIEHKEGEVENLPEEISDAAAKKGVDALLVKFAPDRAAVYLHMFQTQKAGGFPSLTKAIEEEPKLALKAAA
jgi:hypothetical protein